MGTPALSTEESGVRHQHETAMKFNSSAGTAEVAVLLLIPARQRDYVYVPVSLGASLIEFDSDSRHTNVLEDRLININFVPDLEESSIRLQFQVLLIIEICMFDKICLVTF